MIIPKISSSPTKPKKTSSNFDVLALECPPTDNIKTATIAMVGEAPSDIELLKGEPFVGPAGSQLNRICAAVRLARYQIYLTNACKAKLPKNDSNKLWTPKGFRHPDWKELQSRLIDELAEFPGKVIMLLGDTAMRLLIDTPRFSSISKYRGSFYPAEDFPHLKEKLAGKIIGLSFHPSFTTAYRQPIHFYTMIADFNKALKIIENPSLLDDNTDIRIQPSFEDILQFYALVKTKEHVAFDIECTPEFITCFSLAVYHESKIISMSIPILNNQGNYWAVEEEIKVWRGVAEILADSKLKIICQNGMFDIMFILRTMNIKTDNFFFDTMLAQHRVYTELPKGLDYLTSAYTYYPYYKDEGKQSHLKVIKDWPQYWKYNAKDSAYLLPIAEALIKELEEFDSTEVMNYMMDLHKPLMEMEFNGILADKKGVLNAKSEMEKETIELEKQLKDLINKNSGGRVADLNQGSSKQMIAYFYGICMLRPYINRASGNATCNAMALHRIARKGGKGSDEAKLIIKIRKNAKLISTYFNVPIDADNRLRCSHKITGTVSGRIATEKTFFGTGCVLPSAEVLTPNGWLPIKFFIEGMQAMQWDNETDSLSWCTPKHHKEFYSSKMMLLQTEQTMGIYTADHRIPSYHPGHKSFGVKSAYETAHLSERLLPLGSCFNGTKELPSLLLRLMAMVQADGTIEKSNIRISFKKKKKINRFLKLMAAGNIDFTEQSAKEGYRRFCIEASWSKLITKFFFKGKTFGSWMYDLTLEAKEAFIDELKYWDAHRRNQSYIYYTTNKQNVEIISTLIHLVGKSCTIRVDNDNNNGYGAGNNKPLYSINIKPRKQARINRQHWKMFAYTGMVYCLQTPTSFFLIRNQNNIQITGNSNLQNQPYLFKKHLIADKDWILCEPDLAKAEAHVVAYLTQDSNMIKSFESGIDVHSFNASKIFNVPIEKVLEEAHTKKVDQKSTMRYMGKKVVHACVDDQTEVLTPKGWINIAEAIGKPIVSYGKFELPSHWYKRKVKEQLILIQGAGLNQFVTWNHTIPLLTEEGLLKVPAFHLLGKHKANLKMCGRNKVLFPTHITTHLYEGMIYCPTVSSGLFLIRRKGFISYTGNSNYAMGPQTFSDNLAVEDIFKSQSDCKRLLQNYQDRFPGLKRWHRSIEEEVQASRILYNLFESPRKFLGDMGPALFRNAYSFKPQSTVAELLNRGMIKCVNDSRLGKDGFDIRMLTTVHDSILFQFHKDKIPNLLQILLIIKDHMSHTFTYKGRSFSIGLDAKIGQQWAGKTAEISPFTQVNIDDALEKIGIIL